MNATEIAAWWGAGVATIVLLWDIFKWRRSNTPQINVSASPNMETFGPMGREDDRTFIVVEATNIGDKSTTITHLVGFYYKSWWQRFIRRKNEKAFAVTNPLPGTLPHTLEPGGRWIGGIDQNEKIEAWSRDGWLYCGVLHSLSKKGALVRVVIPEIETDGK